MRRLYWLIQSLFNPPYEDDRRKHGTGEYLADKGIANEIDDSVYTLQGEPLVKLDKHLNK